ncbi:hypothetical protein Tco_0632795 [Tanacetum coccineum]
MESSISNSKEIKKRATTDATARKTRHFQLHAWFEQLETNLHDLYSIFVLHALIAIVQLEKENLLEVNPRTCLDALRTQFKEFFASKRVNSSEHLNQCWQKDFKEYMFCEPDNYRRDLLENLDTLEAVIHRAVITYGKLQLQSQDVQINPVQAVDDSLIVSKSSWIESENNNALSTSVNETQLQQHESLVTESTTLEVNLNTDVKALDDGSVITESSRTKSDKHDTSSSLRTYITHAVDADIRPVNDQVPFAEVQLTAQHNVLANEQQHTEQSEPIYDTYLLEKVDSNTTPDSTNMCHRGGEIDQDAEQYQAKSPLLKAEFLKMNDMVDKRSTLNLSAVIHSFINPIKKDPSPIAQPKLTVNLQMVQMMISLTHMNAIKLFMLVQEFKEFKSDEHASNDVWTKQFKPRSSSKDVWTKQYDGRREYLPPEPQDEMNRSFIAQNSYRLERETFSKSYRSCRRTGPDPEPMQEDQTGSNSGKLHVSLAGPNPEHMDDELTEAEEEAVAREVHATHARIVSGPDPEPMQEDQTGSNSGKLHIHVSLAGPNPEHMDDEFLATAYPKVHENLKLITDERVIEENPESHSGSMSSMKNLDDTYNFGDQFLYDKPTEDDQEKSKVIEESDSTIPDPSHQTVTSTPPVIAPFTDVSSTKPSSLVTPPPINTEATTITTSLPEITPFIALQLRVARLEQEMSEVKKTDHSADVLASIKSQVPTVVDEYLGTKLDDALLKILERHTADLIEKYSVLPGPESTDKVDLEEFNLKSALFKHMNKIKSANRNTANYHLYHVLMESLIADEDAMDKEVANKVKDHKRKHDSDDDEDDDDDEGPSAGSNQGKSAKKRRHNSGASGSAQPPTKDDEQSSKKPRESDASASKQHPALTSTGWQITDTRDAVVDSSMPRSDTESEHSEQSSDDIPMQDEGHVSDLEDTDSTHIPKVSTTTWFKPIPEGERPAKP